ncbi:hypothetical protein I4F81_001838 [Pyropia yezoensis]|uniref:Uncharacterized protein n=1 Tax=Pyropia yezoensis TaxID=2788 RepID=A0ACC3BNB0_PYRYE|nr:hypothetical protein I4F81_001838 [Neopyropia yezoensis]
MRGSSARAGRPPPRLLPHPLPALRPPTRRQRRCPRRRPRRPRRPCFHCRRRCHRGRAQGGGARRRGRSRLAHAGEGGGAAAPCPEATMCHRRPTDGAPRPGGRGVPRHREAGAHSCRPATAPPVPPRWALPPGVRQPPATDTHPSPRRHTSRTHTRRSRHRRRAPPPPLSLPDDATAAVAATRATSRHVRPRADAKKTRARCPNRDAQAAGRGSGAGQPVGLRPAVGRGGGRCLGHPCRAPRRPLMGGLRAVRPTAGGDTRTGEASAFAATVRLRLTQEEKVGNARTPGHCRQHQLL